ncbi:MAG TPA: hypothetical protein VGX75_06100 [bacterium]|nr:hypothetical protein [bacterium]
MSALPDRILRLRFERGSLRLDAPPGGDVPQYFTWDDRVAAWRTEALNHFRLTEDAKKYQLTIRDDAADFFDCPGLRPAHRCFVRTKRPRWPPGSAPAGAASS